MFIERLLVHSFQPVTDSITVRSRCDVMLPEFAIDVVGRKV
jgi:hypothetical protein